MSGKINSLPFFALIVLGKRGTFDDAISQFYNTASWANIDTDNAHCVYDSLTDEAHKQQFIYEAGG